MTATIKTDLATIKTWWGRWPNANVGVATGDLMVLDVDAEGMDGWRDLLAEHGQGVGETATAETPEGLAPILSGQRSGDP